MLRYFIWPDGTLGSSCVFPYAKNIASAFQQKNFKIAMSFGNKEKLKLKTSNNQTKTNAKCCIFAHLFKLKQESPAFYFYLNIVCVSEIRFDKT